MSEPIEVTDDHRKVYRLLVNDYPGGVTREHLARLTGFSDRKVRKIIEDLRIIAVQKPHPTLGKLVIGYDDTLNVYTYAKTKEQADRMMREYVSRLRTMHRTLSALAEGAKAFGGADGSVQEALFEAERTLNTRGAWS